MRRWLVVSVAIYLAASVAIAVWLMPTGRERSPVAFAAPSAKPVWRLNATTPEAARRDALHQARVWMPPAPGDVDLGANPRDLTGTLSGPIVRCRYLDGAARGTTAKFDCVLPEGEVVKVKYGGTGEIPAETAASRLLTALGFGADRMYLVPRLRCYGCTRTPFYTNWALDRLHARHFVAASVPDDSYTDFEWPAVERHFGGLPIEAASREGWAWFELDTIDPGLGANRAERDALRLAAMLLSHWDNKATNQRLVCLAEALESTAPCPRPFALINDLGATFGPNKMDLEHWTATPIWVDRAGCTVSMRQFPYSGGTFSDTAISEAGRQLIARELTGLTASQVTSLFAGARFPEGEVRGWTAAFLDKVRQIASGTPCQL